MSPVIEAFRDQRKATMGKTDYVFLNYYGRTFFHHSVNIHTWKTTLKKCGLRERPLYIWWRECRLPVNPSRTQYHIKKSIIYNALRCLKAPSSAPPCRKCFSPCFPQTENGCGLDSRIHTKSSDIITQVLNFFQNEDINFGKAHFHREPFWSTRQI
jgi:hypothetical protein